MRLNFLSLVGWYFDFASIPISFLYTFFITFHRVLINVHYFSLRLLHRLGFSFFFYSSASGLLLFGLRVGVSGFTSGLLFFVFPRTSVDIGLGGGVYKV